MLFNKKQPAASLKRRKRGLGLPIHIKMAYIYIYMYIYIYIYINRYATHSKEKDGERDFIKGMLLNKKTTCRKPEMPYEGLGVTDPHENDIYIYINRYATHSNSY